MKHPLAVLAAASIAALGCAADGLPGGSANGAAGDDAGIGDSGSALASDAGSIASDASDPRDTSTSPPSEASMPDATSDSSFHRPGGPVACGSGDPTGTQTGGGYEKPWGEAVVGTCRRVLGCATQWGGAAPDVAQMNTGTPNQKLLWSVWYYGWSQASGSAAQKAEARQHILAFFDLQKTYGHQAISAGGYDGNEILTSSHYEIWSNGMTCARLLAYHYADPPVLAATRAWWRGEAALYKVFARGGSIDAPGARYFAGQTGGPNQLRDVVYNLMVGGPLPPPADKPNGAWWFEYYNVSAWMLREIYRAGDDLGGASDATNVDFPVLRDPLEVHTKGGDWVFAFPSMRGALDPLFWVASIGGTKSCAPIVAGNPPTSSVPAPTLAGAAAVIVPGTP